MRIQAIEKNYIIIDTLQGSFHFSTRGGFTEIYWHDHAQITFFGEPRKIPTVKIDSEEYPTELIIAETETEWQSIKVKNKIVGNA